jgi:3-methylcrotonyl-CoA carboxylase alpha subunit
MKRILIANRGEIACRIIRTAAKMGIETVAVYSDPDAHARHVKQADYSHAIGGDSAVSSYLDMKKIIAAAKDSGADAIHPGYGFLSENPEFAEAVQASGLVFIGPPAQAIRSMGLKDQAKQLMAAAGVAVIPGYDGGDQSPKALEKQAAVLGYPVMIKARAGGGGKGMCRVDSAKKFLDAVAATKREAESSFGDGHVLLEKYITAPRHIEVQVFADSHGNIVHLFERDCTLQRRHQKVIEEAPAPTITLATRNAMTEAAIAAARAISYQGAGTVEFIVDGSKEATPHGFWFMEMNTRLQVEHPVTEEITGFDLVEWQIRIANGEALPAQQHDIQIRGHAIEARVYAEDADAKFLPTPGTIHYAAFPDNARVDHGINSSDQISPFYDPMIAKVVCKGADRKAALSALYHALGDVRIHGIVTNTAFLQNLISHDDVAAMAIDTSWIDHHLDELNLAATTDDELIAAAGLVLAAADGAFAHNDGWRIWGGGQIPVNFMLNKEPIERRIIFARDHIAVIGGATRQIFAAVERNTAIPNQIILHHDHHRDTISWLDHCGQISLNINGRGLRISRIDRLTPQNFSDSGSSVIAPMTGIISMVNVKIGEQVEAGDVLVRMEAMKMEHALAAPCGGTVTSIDGGVGMNVKDGAVLIEIEKEEA